MSRLQELIDELCPDGVEYKALGELGTSQKGVRVVRKQLEENGSFPVYQNSLTPLGYYEESNRAAGMPFVIGAGAAAQIGYSDVEWWAADDCFTLDIPQNVAVGRFVFYCLLNQQDYLKSRVRKASIPRLARSVVEKLRIPVPPIEVQREVVRILDEYTAAHDELVRQLEEETGLITTQREIAMRNLNDELVSHGYPVEPLGNHADILSGFPFKSSGYVDEGVPVCGGVSIMPGYIDWNTCRYWPSSEGLDQFVLRNEDIVMALDRPWVSGGFKLAQISEEGEGSLLVQRTARVRGTDMHQAYIRALMEMDAFREHCAATGNTVPHVSHKKIESYMVPVPPMHEQMDYVRRAGGITAATSMLVDCLNNESDCLQRQLALFRNHLLSFPEKVA